MPTTTKIAPKPAETNGKMELTVLRRRVTRFANQSDRHKGEIERLKAELVVMGAETDKLNQTIIDMREQANKAAKRYATGWSEHPSWEKLQTRLAMAEAAAKEEAQRFRKAQARVQDAELHASDVESDYQEAQAQIGKAVEAHNQALARAQEAEARATEAERRCAAFEEQHQRLVGQDLGVADDRIVDAIYDALCLLHAMSYQDAKVTLLKAVLIVEEEGNKDDE